MTETDPVAGFRQPLAPNGQIRTSSSLSRLPRAQIPHQRSGHVVARSSWPAPYILKLVAVDVAASGVALLAAYGTAMLEASRSAGGPAAAYAVLLPLAWILAVSLARGYERRFLAVGSEEFRRVCVAGSGTLAVVGTVAWALNLPLARSLVLLALLVTVVISLIGRYLLRCALHRQHLRGRMKSRVLVVGHPGALEALVRTFRRNHYHGMDVVAACVPSRDDAKELQRVGVEVRGTLEDVVMAARNANVDAVIVVSCPELHGSTLRRIGWALEEQGADLLVAPGVVEAVGPRVAVRPVCGVPLLHVAEPELRGVRRVLKGLFDRIAAAAALVVLAPFLLVLAVAVRLDSSGRALYPHTRVGRNGREFTMFKFRSMVRDADAAVVHLKNHDAGNEMLFKMRSDPRVTRVGRFMRKYSLDELPQLLNVALGQMSLVGPRPALPREVAQYDDDVRRRLLVKPGITGLWQINGRSDLDWEESVRLDLRYVENWSFAFDLAILAKTASAVVRGRGAY